MSRFLSGLVAVVILYSIAAADPKGDSPGKSSRTPVPSKPDQEKARKLVRDLFKNDYAKKTPAEMKALSAKLWAQAHETKDDATSRFILFQEARDLAVRGNDLPAALKVVEDMTALFDLDESSEKIAVLDLAAGLSTSANGKVVAEAAQAVYEESLAQEDFVNAGKALKAAQVAADKLTFPTLARTIAEQEKELAAVRAEAERARAALAALQKSPDDKAACLTAGKYLCFRRSLWDQGIPLLAKSGDARLAAAAIKELKRPDSATDQLSVADEWWDAADASAEPDKSKFKQRAGEWYQKALPGLTGLGKTKVEQRLKSIPQRPSSGSTPAVAGKATNKVLRLKGQAHVELEDSAGLLDTTKGDFTVEAWVRILVPGHSINFFTDHANEPGSGRASGLVMGMWSTEPGKPFLTVNMGCRGGGDWWKVFGKARKFDDQWHHLAVCRRPESVRIYYDGKLDGTGDPRSTQFVSGVKNLVVGQSPHWTTADNPDTFDIRTFRVSSTALYDKEFAPRATFGKTKDTLILLDFAAGTDDKVPDVSGHKRHGNIVKGKWVDAADKK